LNLIEPAPPFAENRASMQQPALSATDLPRAAELTAAEQAATLRKITWRLIPLLFICYVIAYIDRINVGFAKLHLQQALGVDAAVWNTVFGRGAGIFFIGYFLFEVPSNLILHHVGARIWIARIMIVWGIVSGAFMFLKSANMFYSMRFLLGVAEAGFFPGVLLYFTYWYPARERARVIAIFAIGGVAAGVIGNPISGALLKLDGFGGLHGWQWLFLIEAIPAILIGFVVLTILPNGPRDARWLSDREKNWIVDRVANDPDRVQSPPQHNLMAVFRTPVLWLLCLTYFLMNFGAYGYEMWGPTIIKSLSAKDDWIVGLIGAIPYAGAVVVMFLVGRNSDRTGERKWHVSLSAAVAAIGFGIAASSKNPFLAMAGIVIAFAGIKSTLGPFWALTTSLLSGTAAAGGIALVNAVGNLGGHFGPATVGKIKDATGSDFAALLAMGGALLGMAICAQLVPRVSRKVP
jgi:sugar phosphate permease